MSDVWFLVQFPHPVHIHRDPLPWGHLHRQPVLWPAAVGGHIALPVGLPPLPPLTPPLLCHLHPTDLGGGGGGGREEEEN